MAQTRFPFEIVYSENTYKNGNIPVTKGEPLRLKDVLRLDSGFAIISHYTGSLFEFSDDTTFQLKDISITRFECETFTFDELDFKILFDTDELPKGLRPYSRVTRPVAPDIIWVYPPGSTASFAKDSDLCFEWQSVEGKMDSLLYTILIKNIFDELIFQRNVIGNSLVIPNSEIRHLDEKMIIVTVIDSVNNKESYDMGLRFGKLCPELSPCQIHTSLNWLKLAFWYESNHFFSAAEKYYHQAMKSSDNKIYDLFFDNFKARAKNYLNK